MTDLLSPPNPSHHNFSPHQQPLLPDVPRGCKEIRPPPGSRYEKLAEKSSPISPGGFFEYDRRLKASALLKRTKRTKSWKTVYLVLRPQCLSLYKDAEETQLRHKIKLSDISTVAMRKDRKRKGEHEGVFGIYTPWRTFHFEASSYADAKSWVDTLRREARIEEDQDLTDSSVLQKEPRGRAMYSAPRMSQDRESSSSPDRLPGNMHRIHGSRPIAIRSSSTIFQYSGPEAGSYSDFSDGPGHASAAEAQSPRAERSRSAYPPIIARDHFYEQAMANTPRSVYLGFELKDEARTIAQGDLLFLKTRTGVRQWKRVWVVLRPKHVAFYKNREEYSALQILPVDDIVDAVEIDSISKKKNFCMQLIMEDRSYRLCANDDDDLLRWLASIKCVLAKRRGSTGAVAMAAKGRTDEQTMSS